MSAEQRTQEDVYKALEKEWDFEMLIEPYREGGTANAPVKRTWGTVIDWLMNKRKLSPESIGAAIFLVWIKIKKDGHFKGDGSYGSAGNEFVHAIRMLAAQMESNKLSSDIMKGLAGKLGEKIRVSFQNDFWIMTPWFIKMFSVKYWKHRGAKRRIRKESMKK